nr:MAG TPA: hypothetical protein [Caudoviricetes sp.]
MHVLFYIISLIHGNYISISGTILRIKKDVHS